MDNTGARDLAYNPEHHARTKHIERRHFFVREMVENMKIRVPYVNTADNLADFFTKPLPARVFVPMRDAIMNCPMSVAAYQGDAPDAPLDRRAGEPAPADATPPDDPPPRARLDAAAVASGAVRTKRRHARSAVPAALRPLRWLESA